MVRTCLPKHVAEKTSAQSTKTWAKAEHLQESTLHINALAEHFPKGTKNLISGTLLFQGVGDPTTTIHSDSWPFPHLLGPCPHPPNKHPPFPGQWPGPQEKNSPLFFPNSCFRLNVESKHMWGVIKTPAATWTGIALGAGGGVPSLHLTFPVAYLAIRATLFQTLWWTFSELEKRPTASIQSLGKLE